MGRDSILEPLRGLVPASHRDMTRPPRWVWCWGLEGHGGRGWRGGDGDAVWVPGCLNYIDPLLSRGGCSSHHCLLIPELPSRSPENKGIERVRMSMWHSLNKGNVLGEQGGSILNLGRAKSPSARHRGIGMLYCCLPLTSTSFFRVRQPSPRTIHPLQQNQL